MLSPFPFALVVDVTKLARQGVLSEWLQGIIYPGSHRTLRSIIEPMWIVPQVV